MLRYILMFVLVMIMVETNAQNPLINYQSNDKMLLRLGYTATAQDIASMHNKISADVNFTSTSIGNDGYFFLERVSGSTITKQQAINFYINEPYLGSASFLYDIDGIEYGSTYDLIVRAKPNVTKQQVINSMSQYGYLGIGDLIPSWGMYQVFVDRYQDLFQVSDNLMQTGLYEYASPNYMTQYTPHTVYGNKTNSNGDCAIVRSNNTTDQFMTDFEQWGLYTGKATGPSEFSNLFLPPTPYTNRAKEFGDINVCHAWEFLNGSASMSIPTKKVDGYNYDIGRAIYVAVIDDGVDTRHYDLNIRRKANGISAYGYDAVTAVPGNSLKMNPIYSPSSPHDLGCPDIGIWLSTQHGTLVSGVIAGKRNNTGTPHSGMAGVAYKSEIMPIRVAWQPNPLSAGKALLDIASIVLAFGWAADNDADVINCSWGFHSANGSNPYAYPPQYFPGVKVIEDAISYATTTGRGGLGCVIVFSSGNQERNHIDWPSSNPDVISVGAMSMCHERISFLGNKISCDNDGWGSNYADGLTVYYDKSDPNQSNWLEVNTTGKLSVVAPGTRIASTTHKVFQITSHNGLFWNDISNNRYFDGTSSAAPHVAGIAALVLSVNNCLTYEEVRDIIELGADRIQPVNLLNQYNYTPSANGLYNDEVGYGKVNAGNSVTLAHDMYRQDGVEVGTKTYHASHFIYAGGQVTDILPLANPSLLPEYRVASGADIKFVAPEDEAIILDDGFIAQYNSDFLADLQNISCSTGHNHYKPSRDNDIVGNGEQPVMASNSLLNNVKVYPNPAKELLNVEFSLQEESTVNLVITNVVGQKVKDVASKNLEKGVSRERISLSGLTSGVYFIGIKTKYGYEQFKFIKE